MADEPLMAIEKLLKASGQRRLETGGNPPELSTSARASLQQEVARVYREAPRRQGYFFDWKLLVPRLAWGLAMALVLFGMGILFYRPYQEAQRTVLAKNTDTVATPTDSRRSPPEKPVLQPATPSFSAAVQEPGPTLAPPTMKSLPAPTETLNEMQSAVAKSDHAVAPEQKQVQASPVPPTTKASGADTAAALPVGRASARSARPMMASASTGGPAVTNTATMQFQAGATTLGSTVAFFKQSMPVAQFRPNFNSPALPKVLQQFRLEQQAGEVRIVDEDGSIYLGRIATNRARYSLANAETGVRDRSGMVLNVASSPAASAAPPAGLVPLYELEASGLNVTLNQRVFLQANVLGNQRNEAAAPAKGTVESVSLTRQGDQSRSAFEPSIMRLIGTATVAETNRLRMDAEAAPAR
jgi:hypothetical protein